MLAPALAPEDPLSSIFPQRSDVFGIHVLATSGVDRASLAHASAVLAEYLDNDEDGEPDNPRVVAEMASSDATLVIFMNEREAEAVFERLDPTDFEGLEERPLQDLYVSEIHPRSAEPAEGQEPRFDATLEEVLHLITFAGYAPAYPDDFAEEPGTTLAALMDLARGGSFDAPPANYPDSAWYTYDDPTCDYGCQVTEYIYWGLTSLLGAQSEPWRQAEIEHEWRASTPELMRELDPGLHLFLTDPRWCLPTRLPDGLYRGP